MPQDWNLVVADKLGCCEARFSLLGASQIEKAVLVWAKFQHEFTALRAAFIQPIEEGLHELFQEVGAKSVLVLRDHRVNKSILDHAR